MLHAYTNRPDEPLVTHNMSKCNIYYSLNAPDYCYFRFIINDNLVYALGINDTNITLYKRKANETVDTKIWSK